MTSHELMGRKPISARPVPFQTTGMDGRMVLQFAPRYTRPQDDTTVMSVFHRTMGGGVSVLLDREWIPTIARWFGSDDREMRVTDIQNNAWLRRHPSGCVVVTIEWNDSWKGKTVALSAEDVRAVHAWLVKIDRDGWIGWKSGVTS